MTIDQILTLALFSSLIFLAFCGNILVCLAIFYDRKLRKQPENLFLVSLAISDLFVSLLVMVFAAANDLLGFWPFGELYCQFWICLDITCSTASILNLCCIAFDRFFHISRPLKYTRYVNRSVILLTILLVWMLSGFVGTAQIIFNAASESKSSELYELRILSTVTSMPHRFDKKNIRMYSIADDDVIASFEESPQCHLNLLPFYAIFSSILSFFLPATIMVFLYTKLYLYARKHVQSIRSQLKQATSLLIMQLASDKIRQVVVHPSSPYTSNNDLISAVSSLSKENAIGEQLSPPDAEQRRCSGNGSFRYHSTNPSENCLTVSNNAMISRNSGDISVSVSDLTIPPVPLSSCAVSQTNLNSYNDQQLMEFCESGIRQASMRSVSDQKARITLGIITGVFLFCWVPFFVINVWRSMYPDSISDSIFKIVTWLGYANSTANPMIYPLFNRDFRRAFVKLVCRTKRLVYCLGSYDPKTPSPCSTGRRFEYRRTATNIFNNNPPKSGSQKKRFSFAY